MIETKHCNRPLVARPGCSYHVHIQKGYRKKYLKNILGYNIYNLKSVITFIIEISHSVIFEETDNLKEMLQMFCWIKQKKRK